MPAKFTLLPAIALAFLAPALALAQDAMAVSTGNFRDADQVHRGSGTVTVAKASDGSFVLELTDFATTPGPDLEVWLVKAGGIDSAGDVTGSEHISLGALQSPNGDQSYALPAGTDPNAFASAVIWCKSFAVLFSAADLAGV